jgi:hypothetical protein
MRMTDFPLTASVAERQAAKLAVKLVDSAAEAISTAQQTCPEDYWSKSEWLARAAVHRALRVLSHDVGSWVHVTDFAVFARHIESLEPSLPVFDNATALAHHYDTTDTSPEMEEGEWVEPEKENSQE